MANLSSSPKAVGSMWSSMALLTSFRWAVIADDGEALGDKLGRRYTNEKTAGQKLPRRHGGRTQGGEEARAVKVAANRAGQDMCSLAVMRMARLRCPLPSARPTAATTRSSRRVRSTGILG